MRLDDPKTMRMTSRALPIATGAIVLAQLAHFGPEKRFAASWIFLTLMSLYLGWFIWKRSSDQEATFFSTRIRPTDSDGDKSSFDLVAMVGAVAIVGLAALLPWLR